MRLNSQNTHQRFDDGGSYADSSSIGVPVETQMQNSKGVQSKGALLESIPADSQS